MASKKSSRKQDGAEEESEGTASEDTPTRKAPARQLRTRRGPKPPKFEGGTILGSVYHDGKNYGPGDEERLSKTKISEASLQMLADKGIVEGFGTTAAPEAEEPEDE
jgi:hypothetical protein